MDDDYNIELAWKRVKRDLKNRSFINPVFITSILETDIQTWLAELELDFQSGRYTPQAMEIIEIPKGKGLIRPGSLLSLQDHVYYSCLVHQCYSNILERIKWAQNAVDFAYIPTPQNINSDNWFKANFTGWDQFRKQSLNAIDTSTKFVVITDIAGFYENIDLATLTSDLRSCNILQKTTAKLSTCLNRWAQLKGKGIPQGNSPSDLLAKLYLNSIDHGLKNAGYKHLRYVDDIRIFCTSSSEAKNALIELTRLLRKRGLNLQSAKTRIVPAPEALKFIQGVHPLIQELAEKITPEMRFQIETDYSDEESVEKEQEQSPLEAIQDAFRENFIDSSKDDFNPTLFHFLINSLTKGKDSFALNYCLSILDKHPEETSYILKYSKSFNGIDDWLFNSKGKMIKILIEFITSEDAIYDYQNYQLLNWLLENVSESEEELINICRIISSDENRPYYLRSIVRVILGNYGNDADLDKLEDILNNTNNDFERAELVCCLNRLEKNRRNSLLGRIQNDGIMVSMAVKFIRGR